MLISRPTGTSTIFGAFQAIISISLEDSKRSGAIAVPYHIIKVTALGSSLPVAPAEKFLFAPQCSINYLLDR
jgi:hypothetical protein